MKTNTVAENRTNSDADDTKSFIAILHFNEVTVDVVEVAATRESLVRKSVWGMARERMQENDEEKLQNTGEDDKWTPVRTKVIYMLLLYNIYILVNLL